MTAIAIGTMMAVGAVARGAQRAFPGSLPGSLLAAVILALVAWWVFGALRRWRTAAPTAAQ
jgi:hypothetical protein